MRPFLKEQHLESYANLESRIKWGDLKSLEERLSGAVLKKIPDLDQNKLNHIIWDYWRQYFSLREESHGCSYQDLTIVGCLIPRNHGAKYTPTETDLDDFVAFFLEQLEFGIVSANDNIRSFDVDFDQRFVRNFAALNKRNQQYLIAMKIMSPEPKKSLAWPQFKRLISKKELTPADLEIIQENIDFYWRKVDYKLLRSIYKQCREENLVQLTVSRQCEETLWFLESNDLPYKHIDTFIDITRRLERLYRGRSRRSEFSRYAVDGKEAAFNHLLRGTDLIAGVMNSVNKDGALSEPMQSQIKALINDPDLFLETILTVLIHDCLEDKLKDDNGREFSVFSLSLIFEDSGLEPDMISRLINRAMILNAKAAYEDEATDENGQILYADYLKRIERDGDFITKFAKAGADIAQNLCSPHSNPFEKENPERFQPKYKAKWEATDKFLEPFMTAGLYDHFPIEVKNRMRSNQHLQKFCGNVGGLYERIDDIIKILPKTKQEILDEKLAEVLSFAKAA